jgi:hypothetical protein
MHKSVIFQLVNLIFSSASAAQERVPPLNGDSNIGKVMSEFRRTTQLGSGSAEGLAGHALLGLVGAGAPGRIPQCSTFSRAYDLLLVGHRDAQAMGMRRLAIQGLLDSASNSSERCYTRRTQNSEQAPRSAHDHPTLRVWSPDSVK